MGVRSQCSGFITLSKTMHNIFNAKGDKLICHGCIKN